MWNAISCIAPKIEEHVLLLYNKGGSASLIQPESEIVLGYLDHYVASASGNRYVFRAVWDSEYLFDGDYVTHWMPLPEKPSSCQLTTK